MVGGDGIFLATVTEADIQTFTVIKHGGCGGHDAGWEETHVLREHCSVHSWSSESIIQLDSAAQATTSQTSRKRGRTSQ